MAREHGKILAIPPEELKEVAAEEPDLSDIILKAFLARRSWGPYELESMKRAPTPPSSRTSGRISRPSRPAPRKGAWRPRTLRSTLFPSP